MDFKIAAHRIWPRGLESRWVCGTGIAIGFDLIPNGCRRWYYSRNDYFLICHQVWSHAMLHASFRLQSSMWIASLVPDVGIDALWLDTIRGQLNAFFVFQMWVCPVANWLSSTVSGMGSKIRQKNAQLFVSQLTYLILFFVSYISYGNSYAGTESLIVR